MTLLALIATYSYSQSDNVSNNPELQITKEGKRLEAVVSCLDAIEAPTKFNAYAKPFITLPDFPKNSTSITREQLRKNIDQYFKDHPNLITEVREAARKANEKFYGPSTYYNN